MNANGVLYYPTLSNGTVAGLALLVPMLVVFGEPISLPVNHCPTDIAALRKQSETQVIDNNKTFKKPICIKEELYNNASFDFVGITAGLQLYFASRSFKKLEKPYKDKSILEDDCLPVFLQSWMFVNFQLDSNVDLKQYNLLVLDLRVKQTTIEAINSLHFLLNINTFFPAIRVKSLVSGSQSDALSREFDRFILL